MFVLAEIQPLDPSDGSRPTLRVCNANLRELCGHDGEQWWPAISKAPNFRIELFDGDFSSDTSIAVGQISLRLDVLAKADSDAPSYIWTGAAVTVSTWEAGTATEVFCGKVKSFTGADRQISLSMEVDDEPFTVDVLSATYAGTGGIEGGADLKGRLKPWLFGRAANVEPVLIDVVNNVYQFSAYGEIAEVTTLYERGSEFSGSLGDYADYAALVAAAIPEGAWGSCLADGLVRLGAPAYGVITGDVDGDNEGSTFRRKTGAILSRISSALSISGSLIDSSSLTALDSAVPYNVNLYLTEQISFLDLARRLARPCNSVAGIDWLGKLFVSRVAFDTASVTLDVQGRQLPAVAGATEATVKPPYRRVMLGASRSWKVHSFDEIATAYTLIDKGTYDASTIYREGNIVSLADGSSWLFVNVTPQAGVTPGTNVAVWQSLDTAITYDDGTPLEDLKPGEAGADVTGGNTAAGIVGQGPGATAAGTDVLNQYIPAGDANRVRFSRMEKGTTGWILPYNPGPLTFTPFAGESGGLRYFQIYNIPFTASGQAMSIGNDYSAPYRIPVRPGERICAQANVQADVTGGGLDHWRFVLYFHDSSGAAVGTYQNIATSTAAIGLGDGPQSAFFTVPAGAYYARFELYLYASGAGTGNLAIAQPMISGATAGQTVPPAFSPGPSSAYGADVTSDNTAAAIAGQGALATLNNVATVNIVANAVTGLATAYTSGSASFNSLGWATAQTVSLATFGFPVVLKAGLKINLTHNSVYDVYIRILRDGTDITGSILMPVTTAVISGFQYQYTQFLGTFSFADAPGAGTHTYTLQITTNVTPTASGGISYRYLEALELKK